MINLLCKEINEKNAFQQFLSIRKIDFESSHIENRKPPEPDLFFTHATEGPIAFELVSLTDGKIAQIQASLTPSMKGFYTEDPSITIVQKKLCKEYTTECNHIELLIYSNGQIVTPDDVIIANITPLLFEFKHQFKFVWFMGEVSTVCLYPEIINI
ncbi:hypothetical protein [Deefgea piscis]|uniref:hypothetical protein n=1 Tax=Deefgea piscis TaxID=2739061 RepID=UPI001C82608F|nr:hypothetical protein [Deefgea piscis]QZA82577.1 hypothetical protein K4H25_08085 [Deefgea piscis]